MFVERTFSCLENFRGLTIDYEFLAETAEAMVQIAFIQIMLNNLSNEIKTVPVPPPRSTSFHKVTFLFIRGLNHNEIHRVL